MTVVPGPFRTFSAVLSAGIVMMSLVSCGSDTPSTQASVSATSQRSLRPGAFHAALPYGASVHVNVPAGSLSDHRIDVLRQDAGVNRAVYASVHIDNSAGERPVSVNKLILTTADGARYQFEALSRVLPTWRPSPAFDGSYTDIRGQELKAAHGRSLTQRIEALTAEYAHDVPAGASAENVLVGDLAAVPPEFESMEIIPSIGSQNLDPVTPAQVRAKEIAGNTVHPMPESSLPSFPQTSEAPATGPGGPVSPDPPQLPAPPPKPVPGVEPDPHPLPSSQPEQEPDTGVEPRPPEPKTPEAGPPEAEPFEPTA